MLSCHPQKMASGSLPSDPNILNNCPAPGKNAYAGEKIIENHFTSSISHRWHHLLAPQNSTNLIPHLHPVFQITQFMANVLIVPTLLGHRCPEAVQAKEPLDPGVSPVEAVDFRDAEMVHLGLTHGYFMYFACE